MQHDGRQSGPGRQELAFPDRARSGAPILRREREESRKLSRAAVETLAIIAYHEPVSRAEIESIRGVQISKGTLDVLMEAGWVRPPGRRETPGGR
jgi:segregation and condensation protein B